MNIKNLAKAASSDSNVVLKHILWLKAYTMNDFQEFCKEAPASFPLQNKKHGGGICSVVGVLKNKAF